MAFKKGQSGNPGRQFEKGVSGNPKGRPKAKPDLEDLLCEVLGEEKDGITAMQAILMKLRQQATGGNIKAAEVLMNRAYGMATQKHEHTGKDGDPIQYVYRLPDGHDMKING